MILIGGACWLVGILTGWTTYGIKADNKERKKYDYFYKHFK